MAQLVRYRFQFSADYRSFLVPSQVMQCHLLPGQAD
jgi:hypothetical protein